MDINVIFAQVVTFLLVPLAAVLIVKAMQWFDAHVVALEAEAKSHNQWLLETAIEDGVIAFKAIAATIIDHKAAVIKYVQDFATVHHINIDIGLLETQVEAAIQKDLGK